jgi:hypothetical protein
LAGDGDGETVECHGVAEPPAGRQNPQ